MINITEEFIQEIRATFARIKITLEDNPTIEDKSGFYNQELLLFEINSILKTFEEDLKE